MTALSTYMRRAAARARRERLEIEEYIRTEIVPAIQQIESVTEDEETRALCRRYLALAERF